MRRPGRVSRSVERFRAVGGVVEHCFFEGPCAAREDHLRAVADCLAVAPTALAPLPGRRIDRRAFLGAWYDEERRGLVKVGRWKTAGGRALSDPLLRDLGEDRVVSGGGPLPHPGASFGYAYAFSAPPYPLRAAPAEIDALFHRVLPSFMPSHAAAEIYDWTAPALNAVSPYFAPGAEWWGMFLYSVALPAEERLCVIMASSTD